MPKPRAGVTWTAACKLAHTFPGVEVGTSYGTPALKVKGKFMARLREDGESLAVRCGFDERDFRLREDPAVFFVTDHYAGYPMVLVHLSLVTAPVLRDVLEEAWRQQAPKKLIREFDAP